MPLIYGDSQRHATCGERRKALSESAFRPAVEVEEGAAERRRLPVTGKHEMSRCLMMVSIRQQLL